MRNAARCCACAAALVLAGCLGPRAQPPSHPSQAEERAATTRPTDEARPVEDLLTDLRRGTAAERAQALADLCETLPESRPRLIEIFGTPPGRLQMEILLEKNSFAAGEDLRPIARLTNVSEHGFWVPEWAESTSWNVRLCAKEVIDLGATILVDLPDSIGIGGGAGRAFGGPDRVAICNISFDSGEWSDRERGTLWP